MDWKIGEVAVCIKIGHIERNNDLCCPPLRLNSEYILQNIYQCPKCGETSFDVGLSSPTKDGEHLGTICCTEYIPCIEIHWCSSQRFAKKRTKEEELEEAIENENYEKAGELRDEINK